MKILKIFFIFLVFFYNSQLYSYSSNPRDFVNELVNDVIAKLSDTSVSEEEKAEFIEKIALENVDINALGLYTLGELRKSAIKQDIQKYQLAFEKYFLKTLTSRMKDFSSSSFEVIDSDQKSSNYTIIKSKVKPENNDPEIEINWRVYTKDPTKPLIRDLIVEGLSLARTQKEEFASILSSNNNDINVLINKLKDFVKN